MFLYPQHPPCYGVGQGMNIEQIIICGERRRADPLCQRQIHWLLMPSIFRTIRMTTDWTSVDNKLLASSDTAVRESPTTGYLCQTRLPLYVFRSPKTFYIHFYTSLNPHPNSHLSSRTKWLSFLCCVLSFSVSPVRCGRALQSHIPKHSPPSSLWRYSAFALTSCG